jgi:hypothetical protein
MATSNTAEVPVEHPTYMADIRFFFRTVDIDHMGAKGIDLGTYDGVKRNRFAIFAQVSPPDPNMPILNNGQPDVANQWSPARLATFNNWMTDNCPLGTATSATTGETPVTASAPGMRVRKNVNSLGNTEIELLRKAFSGLMERANPTDEYPPPEKQSYAWIAGFHGLPGSYCMHHIDGYNPWHRTYLKVMEDALRTVDDCEDVTLPYWDLSDLPEVLQQAPLATYHLETAPGPLDTARNTPAEIADNLNTFGGPGGVFAQIAKSLKQTLWGRSGVSGYQLYSIQAHDNGHGSIGPTMGNQSIASYDPIFWFYHCNLDRLWLSWQTKVRATDFTGFRSTLTPEALKFFQSPLNAMPPWDDGPLIVTTDQTLAFGISYDKLDLSEEDVLENKVGSIDAARSFSIKSSSPVSVAVKDIDRLNIPGSFVVNLLADGEPVAQQYFFQPDEPRGCANCVKNGLVNVQFHLDQADLLDKKLSVSIAVPSHEGIGTPFPMSQVGNPTINARLLLDDE